MAWRSVAWRGGAVRAESAGTTTGQPGQAWLQTGIMDQLSSAALTSSLLPTTLPDITLLDNKPVKTNPCL